MSITSSVIITTYNKPKELEMVLCGLSMQKTAPTEILIADDGSSHETASVINKWQQICSPPVIHVWHADDGFQKPLICDKAVKAARGEYLIFIDGDSIPDPYWVQDHLKAIRENTVLCGRRVRLGPKVSRSIDLEAVQSRKLRTFSKKVLLSALNKDTKRLALGIRVPMFLARLLHPKERRLMGVNFSLHKELFQRLGGYRAAAGEYMKAKQRCREDAQLEILLIKNGVRRFPLINRAIVYHLYRPERPLREGFDAKVKARYLQALQEREKLFQQ
jgi:glycosyltransferase involved in cell wall biosynthesis